MMQLPDDIWLRAVTFDEAQVDAWLRLLSSEERARYERFPVEKRQREFLMGRAVLRMLLAERLSRTPAEVPLHVTDAGAVEAPETPYRVSLAHARERAVAVASPRRVGVDLEHVRTCRAAVIRFALNPDERPLLDTLPMTRDRAFILCWTLKEAVLKALGTGLRRSPKKVRLDIDVAAQTATASAWDGSVWTVLYEASADSFLSVAYPAE